MRNALKSTLIRCTKILSHIYWTKEKTKKRLGNISKLPIPLNTHLMPSSSFFYNTVTLTIWT